MRARRLAEADSSPMSQIFKQPLATPAPQSSSAHHPQVASSASPVLGSQPNSSFRKMALDQTPKSRRQDRRSCPGADGGALVMRSRVACAPIIRCSSL